MSDKQLARRACATSPAAGGYVLFEMDYLVVLIAETRSTQRIAEEEA